MSDSKQNTTFEQDLVDLYKVIYEGKKYILLITLLFLILGYFFANFQNVRYKAKSYVHPISINELAPQIKTNPQLADMHYDLGLDLINRYAQILRSSSLQIEGAEKLGILEEGHEKIKLREGKSYGLTLTENFLSNIVITRDNNNLQIEVKYDDKDKLKEYISWLFTSAHLRHKQELNNERLNTIEKLSKEIKKYIWFVSGKEIIDDYLMLFAFLDIPVDKETKKWANAPRERAANFKFYENIQKIKITLDEKEIEWESLSYGNIQGKVNQLLDLMEEYADKMKIDKEFIRSENLKQFVNQTRNKKYGILLELAELRKLVVYNNKLYNLNTHTLRPGEKPMVFNRKSFNGLTKGEYDALMRMEVNTNLKYHHKLLLQSIQKIVVELDSWSKNVELRSRDYRPINYFLGEGKLFPDDKGSYGFDSAKEELATNYNVGLLYRFYNVELRKKQISLWNEKKRKINEQVKTVNFDLGTISITSNKISKFNSSLIGLLIGLFVGFMFAGIIHIHKKYKSINT